MERLVRGARSSFLIRSSGYALGFGAQVVTARMMNVDGFGVFWYAASWAALLAILVRFGYDLASVRFIPEYIRMGRTDLLRGFLRHRLRTVGLLAAVTSTGIVAFVLIMGDRLNDGMRVPFLLLALLVPLMAWSGLLEQSLRAVQMVRLAQVPLAVVRPVLLMLGVVIVGSLVGVVTPAQAMWVYVLAFSVIVVMSSIIWRRARPSDLGAAAESVDRSRMWRSVAFSMVLVSGFGVVLRQADVILTGLLAGTTVAGQYVVASKTATLMVFILTAINFVAGPMISDFHARRDQASLQRVASLAVRGSAIASTVIGILLIAFGRSLLGIFGEAYVIAYVPLVVLVLGRLVNAVVGPVNLLLNMTGHHAVVARSLGAGVVINVVLNVVLIPRYGATGAATATAIAEATMNVWMVVMVRRRLGIRTVTSLWSNPSP